MADDGFIDLHSAPMTEAVVAQQVENDEQGLIVDEDVAVASICPDVQPRIVSEESDEQVLTVTTGAEAANGVDIITVAKDDVLVSVDASAVSMSVSEMSPTNDILPELCDAGIESLARSFVGKQDNDLNASKLKPVSPSAMDSEHEEIGTCTVKELLMDIVELVDVKPDNVEPGKQPVEVPAVDNFVIQRNYIPEHLLNYFSDDSSSDSTDSSSSWSSDESSSNSDSSSADSDSDDETAGDNRRGNCKQVGNKRRTVKTKGELDLADLPPIQNLQISVDRKEIQDIGRVLSIVDCLVVVQSLLDKPALNLDTVLFFEDGEPLGQIFDVFGPVIRPLYSVRFNTVDDIKAKNIIIGAVIYYAPKKTEFTAFVFAEQLRRMKGSDASWENNNEPPDKHLDYSDDEQEKLAKRRLKNVERKDNDGGCDEDDADKPLAKRQVRRQNRRGRGGRREGFGFQSIIPEGCAAMSASSTLLSSAIRPARFSMPPPSLPKFYVQHEQQHHPSPSTFSEGVSNPFCGKSAPAFAHNAGQFSHPPLPRFNPHVPPPRAPMRWTRPPVVSQTPISSLFRTANQTPPSAAVGGSAMPSISNLLPNPFRALSNVNASVSQTASDGGETAAIPRFPPLGFVPRM